MREFLMNLWHPVMRALETELFTIGASPVTALGLIRVLVILAIAAALSRAIRSTLERVAHRWGGMNRASLYALGRVLHYIVLALGLAIGLTTIGVDFGQTLR